jgi:hypothetical protein
MLGPLDPASTLPRMRQSTAMLIGIEAELIMPLTQTLSVLGYRVLTVAHVAAASERIPVVMPLLVIASSSVLDNEQKDLEDRVVAVGAELVWMPPGSDEDRANALVRDAAAVALERRSST